MRKITYFKTMLLALILLVGSGSAWGQLSITSTGTAFTQNFDGIGSTGTAALPSGWKIDQGTSYSTGTTATTLAYGTSGTGAVTGSSGGGAINWANGVTASSTDRAIGFLTTGSYSSPRNLFLQVTNNSGSIINSLSISFDIEKYRTGTRAWNINFYSSSDGSTWTAQTSGDQSYGVDGANAVVNPPTTTSKTLTISGLSISNGSSYYLRWAYTGLAGSTNAQGLGIDNFSITGATSGLLVPPTLTADATSNDVDNNIDIAFTDDATWRGAVTAVKVGGTTLTATTDYVLTAGNLQLKPSGGNSLLTTASPKSVTIEAAGYGTASVTQQINAGAAAKLGMKTQPAAPAVNGGTLATQPAVYIQDQYGNTTASTANVTAAVGAGSWTLGGTLTVAAVAGTATFSGLTATSATAVTGATIGFTSDLLTATTSGAFDIPVPAPTIIIPTTTLTGFSYMEGAGPSTEKTFTVSGLNLTNDISIAPTTDYEISTGTGASFVATNPITLTQSGGTVGSTTIYVRLKAGLSQGSYNSEVINVTSTGATAATVTCSGSVKGTYYSNGSGDPVVLTNWKTNRDGTGNSPADFTSGEIFVIENGDNMTTTTTWAISGTGSKLWIENGGILTANNAITLASATTFQIDNGGAYIHNNTVAFGSTIFNGIESFAPNSTVEFRNWNTSGPSVTAWGNVKFNGATATGSMQLSGNMTTINGNLDVIATGGGTYEVRFATGTAPTVTIAGNYTQSGGIINLASTSGSSVTTLNVAGNFAVNGGTFTSTSTGSKVILNGSSSQSVTNAGTISVANFEVSNSAGVSLASNATLSNLTINTGAILNIPAGKQLTVSTTLTNNGVLNLLSDATGTATILTPVTITTGTAGTYKVQQYLSSARNWYVSSPVSNALAPSGYTYYNYNETGSSWGSTVPSFTKGVGYIALPGSPGSTLTFATQSGGTLNSGNVDVTLTKSGATKTGFNLIGNPYPAHLTWTKTFVDNNSTRIEPTIWYRTNAGTVNLGGDASWSFKTINASTGEASPLGTSNIIPPMQAFWVRAVSAGTLTLNSDLTLSHQASNPLKAPAINSSDRQRLRLQVNNGTTTDEAVIYIDPNASNSFDRYDSPKFEDPTTVTQIYTTAGTEKLVINGMNSLPLNTEIGLEFVPGNATSFSIRANEVSNLPLDVKVILKDNVTLAETDLTNGVNTYEFSPATTTSNRFSVIFRTTGAVTGIPTATNDANLLVYRNANNQIAVQIKGLLNDSYSLNVYNSVGQRLSSKQATAGITILDAPQSGVYFVTVKGNGINTTNKVVIN